MLNQFKRIRETLNLLAYDSQKRVLSTLRVFTFFVAFFSIGLCIYYYGFDHAEDQANFLLNLIKGAFGVFIVNYVSHMLYSFERLEFLKSTWLEALLILLLIYDGISLYLFNIPLLEITFQKLGFINFTPFYIFFIQLYMLTLAWIEISRISKSLWNVKVNPVVVFVLFYCIIIFIGTVLLLLPEMSIAVGSMSIVEAFFTAASAVTLTGLQVVEVMEHFTFKGQLVLLLLIQTGGITIISFATFFALFLKKGIGIKHQSLMEDLTGSHAIINSKRMMREIAVYVIILEVIGSAVLFFHWPLDMPFTSLGQKVFYSVFHAIAAFCNTGFTLLEGGLQNPYTTNLPLMHIALAGLILMGAIGFPASRDLFGLSNLRERLKKPWKTWKTSTSIAVMGTMILLFGGGILFFLLERNNVLAELSLFESITTALFHAVSRTAGLMTVDFSNLTTSTYVILILLMFIGGASGSFAGGIKTSTFLILAMSFWATVRGKKKAGVWQEDYLL